MLVGGYPFFKCSNNSTVKRTVESGGVYAARVTGIDLEVFSVLVILDRKK